MAAIQLLLSVCFLLVTCQAVCPNFVTRAMWGARPASSVISLTSVVPKVIVQETVTKECDNRAKCSSLVREIQDNDMLNNAKHDITCSFLIGGDGRAYIGRGWNTQTEHTDSLVFCVIGTFDDKTMPNELQRSALENLLNCGVDKNELTSNYTVQTLRDVDSQSTNPGQSLQDLVEALPHSPSM